MEEYYFIQSKNESSTQRESFEEKGLIVKIKNKSLESYVSFGITFKEAGCALDAKGNLTVKEKYYFNLIGEEMAREIKENYNALKDSQENNYMDDSYGGDE